MIVVWSGPAEADAEGIIDFISADDPATARTIIARFREAAARLTDFPSMGRSGHVRGTRELVVPGTPFILCYRIERDRVHILRVWHGARLWPDRF